MATPFPLCFFVKTKTPLVFFFFFFFLDVVGKKISANRQRIVVKGSGEGPWRLRGQPKKRM
jgi:hypothetical protein